MSNNILVFLEQRENKIKKQSLEAAEIGQSLKNKLNSQLIGIVTGDALENLNDLTSFSFDKVVFYKNPQLLAYSSTAYSKIISAAVQNFSTGIVLFSHTSMGRDLAPIVAAKLKAGFAPDCTNLELIDNKIMAARPIYAGKAVNNFSINTDIKVFSIRPNSIKVTASAGSEINLEEISIPDSELDLRTKVISVNKSSGKIDVAEADRIVSGGRGMKDPANFSLVEELAGVIGAAVGASRAVVDAGWRPHAEQVGQTGKTVSPNLYIACGISGAIQHLAGMSSSKCIVAINKDKDAPIFQVADFGIIGDVMEVLPKVKDEIKNLLEK